MHSKTNVSAFATLDANEAVASVAYRLTDDNELVIEYGASCDRPTPVNLTQHNYYNLRGESAGRGKGRSKKEAEQKAASQAWQAINALPRQFLLLLTATPVQNSLEELYNLVTLLQPGQLPTPKEFRARFIDPKRPRQPREPEELRRLLGQVMIRNTRANAGIALPPRRADFQAKKNSSCLSWHARPLPHNWLVSPRRPCRKIRGCIRPAPAL